MKDTAYGLFWRGIHIPHIVAVWPSYKYEGGRHLADESRVRVVLSVNEEAFFDCTAEEALKEIREIVHGTEASK